MPDQTEDQSSEQREQHTTVDDGIATQPTVVIDDRPAPAPTAAPQFQSQLGGLTNSLAEIAASLIILRNTYTQVIANQELMKKLMVTVTAINVIGWLVAILIIAAFFRH
jgi:hypothetical protein